jgi:hypothetical protein
VLASRLGALLAAIHPLLGTEPSRAFIHNSPAPRLMLDDPAATAAKLYAMRDAYVGVMGAPPRPLLLSSSQSSYSRGTVGKFTEKLRYFESK